MPKFPLQLLLVILLLVSPAWAQDYLAEGDRLTRWGVLQDADSAYQKALETASDSKARKVVLFRRLALAEALQNRRGAESIIATIRKEPLDENDEIRLLASEGTLAYQAREYGPAEKFFSEVERQTQNPDNSVKALSRFAALSFLYHKKVTESGWPGDAEIKSHAAELFKPLDIVPKQHLLEPLAVTRANLWYEIWVRAYLKRILNDPEMQNKRLQDLSNGVKLINLAFLGRFLQLKDPEAGALVLQYTLLMAEELAPKRPAQAQQWLAGVGNVIKTGRRVVKQAKLGPEMTSTGLAYFEARFAEVKGQILIAQGKVNVGLRELAQAATTLKQAELEIPLLRVLIKNLAIRLKLRKIKNPEMAKPVLEEAKMLATKLNRPLDLLTVLVLEATLERKLGSKENAVRLHKDAIVKLEQAAPYLALRSLEFDIISAAYDPLIQLLTAQNQTAQALEYQQRRMALTQLSKHRLSGMKTKNPEVEKALAEAAAKKAEGERLQAELEAAQVLKKKDEIAKIESSIGSNRAEFLKALNDIGKADPQYASAVIIRPTSFARIQSKLPAGALLIQYCITDSETLIFTATKDNLSIQKVPVTREEMVEKIRAGRKAAHRVGSRLLPLETLYELLIKPVEGQVDKSSVVIIAPTEELYHVPFAALVRSQNGKKQFLIDQTPLVTVAGTDTLLSITDQKQSNDGHILIIGDPDGSLPAAREEASEIGALFPSSTTYIADQAKGDLIRRIDPKTKLLHLATHAVTNSEDVNSSYLVMADNGRLTLGEVYGLDLDGLSLVTLSACKTALGQDQPTWAVASLAQAFHLAGAETLIASLWSVSDDSTRNLMVHFYSMLQQGKPKAEAMRLAQLELKKSKRYSHPYYWSGFSVIGDWQ